MAPSLLKKDRYDQWVINEENNPTMMAAAMAKHESFRYCPDEVYKCLGNNTLMYYNINV